MVDPEKPAKQPHDSSETENSATESSNATPVNDSPQSPSALSLARLNRMLSCLAGSDFQIRLLFGEEASRMDEPTLSAMSECYARLAREKWYESWTPASAREEIKKYLEADDDRINVISLVFQGDKVIGLCWAFIFSAHDPGDLAAHFSSARLRNRDNHQATSEWISQVGGQENLVSIRELGVLGQYRKIRAPLLCSPVFARALSFGCKYIFLRTPVNSQSLKWSLGLGFAPLHYFVVNQMLLMLGSLENTVRDQEFRILDYFASQLSTILDQDRDMESLIQQAELNHAEKTKVMQGLSANIAHEMRTPLSGVRASMDGMEDYLPVLLEAYRKVVSESPDLLPSIREDHLSVLEKTPERITLMIDQANSVIDMLLMNLRDNTVDKRQFRIFSAAECLRQAVDRYPFRRGEREKVSLSLQDDFYLRGIDSLFIYVIFNMLKNALFSVNSALKGEISIRLESARGVNRMVFRDTGEGIEEEVVARIFEGFFSTREEGTGVGLAFCRRTIRSFDGDITCVSVPGEFAEFTITLPAT